MVSMHKMPVIWGLYLEFMLGQAYVTRMRRLCDRALTALPVTQHERVWPLYLRFIGQPGIPMETAVRVSAGGGGGPARCVSQVLVRAVFDRDAGGRAMCCADSPIHPAVGGCTAVLLRCTAATSSWSPPTLRSLWPTCASRSCGGRRRG